jgi:hypothetical protein
MKWLQENKVEDFKMSVQPWINILTKPPNNGKLIEAIMVSAFL